MTLSRIALLIALSLCCSADIVPLYAQTQSSQAEPTGPVIGPLITARRGPPPRPEPECEPAPDGTIVVCGEIQYEDGEAYRIPPALRAPSPDLIRDPPTGAAVLDNTASPGACGTTGSGAGYGCTQGLNLLSSGSGEPSVASRVADAIDPDD